MATIQLTPPTAEPVSLELAKQHLRVTHDAEDDLIQIYISAARDACENYINRPVSDGTAGSEYQTFSSSYCDIHVPYGSTITSIDVGQSDGTYTVITPDYTVSATGEVTFLDTSQLPDLELPDAVRVTYTPPVTPVPPALIGGMLLVIGHLYENREDSVIGASAVSLPRGAESLWFPYRVRLGV